MKLFSIDNIDILSKTKAGTVKVNNSVCHIVTSDEVTSIKTDAKNIYKKN